MDRFLTITSLGAGLDVDRFGGRSDGVFRLLLGSVFVSNLEPGCGV